ncbi:MAG: MoaD/ThiS family protein [Pseudomonadota bacterium]
MKITVKLGGPLRQRVPGHQAGELTLDLPDGARVSDALKALELWGDVVRVLMVNGRPIRDDQELKEGDRLGLWPRELAFNMYVATNFFNPLARGEIEGKDK